MSYYGCKKLISVRVDEDLYSNVKKQLEKENEGRYWNKTTFASLVEKMMNEYVSNNKKRAEEEKE